MVNNLLLRQKYHQYFMYTPAGVYLGILPNVAPPFGYNQAIGTTFVQMQVVVENTADVAVLANEPITDENGNPITDEAGNNLLIERQPDIVGSSNSNALIANGNLIKVYEFDNYNPNGIKVFDGYVSKWKTVFGSNDNIVLTCLSNGTDANNYLVTSGDSAFISQTTDDGNNWGIQPPTKSSNQSSLVETFTVPSNIILGAISCELTTPESGTLTVQVYALVGTTPNPLADTLVTSGSIHLLTLSTKTVEKVSMSSFPTLVTGTNYYFMLSWNNDSGSSGTAFIYVSQSNPYANGFVYMMTLTSSWAAASQSTNDAYFIIWQHGTNIVGSYTNNDPSFIINDIMTNYISQGGLLQIPAAGYANTGTLATYTFKMQTVLQAIQAVLSLAPANWYWYADPATGILNFAQANTVADFTLIKGRHMNDIDIEATKENIKNVAYLSGGDDGTSTSTNILVKVTNPSGSNRTGLALLSDNRINSTTGGTVTAKLVAQNYLNNNASETYITNVSVEDQTMDINTIKLGQMCGFSGFGNFVDGLLLQVVGVNRSPDQVTLQLGTLPKRDSQVVATLQAQLQYQQTVANPSTPS